MMFKMIRLNCDLGEGFGVYSLGDEELIMPYIQMANIACGFHAGDPLGLQKTINLALKYNVTMGAHPSYPDLVGFGRRSLKCEPEEIEAFVIYQIAALQGLVNAQNGYLDYVKPHGALYNDMMKDESIFQAILKATYKFRNLKLMILSTCKNAQFQNMADKFGVKLIYEVFADRAYTSEGFLVPRTQKGSVLHNKNEVIARLKQLQNKGSLQSIDGKEIFLQADSLCVHDDNPEAIELVKSLKENLI